METYKKFSQYFAKRDYQVFIFLFCLITIHFILGLRFEPPENGIYKHLVESINTDFDFNVFNQVKEPSEKWLVTKAYNHPDHRLPFISILYYFPNLISKLVKVLLPLNSSFSTDYLLYLLLSLITALQILKISSQYKSKEFFQAFLYTTLCSVGIHYLVIDPGEVNFASIFLNTALFCQLFLQSKPGKESSEPLSIWLFYIPLALFILVRPEAIFWAFAIGVHELFTKNRKRILLILVSIAFPKLISVITSYIQLGSKETLLPILDFGNIDFWGVLFGGSGLFIMQPIFLLCIIGLLLGLREDSILKRKASLFALVIILMKITLISSMRSSTMDTFVGRNYMGELPLWSFGIFILLQKHRKMTFVVMAFAIIVNFLHINLIIYDWITSDRIVYTSPKTLSLFSEIPAIFKKVGSLYHYRFVTWNPLYYWDMIKVTSLSAFLLTVLNRFISYKMLMKSLTVLALLFFTLNSVFNRTNAIEMKNQGLFDQVVVGKGDLLYYDEVLDYIHIMEAHGKVFDSEEKRRAEEFRRTYVDSIIDDIIIDPIGFKADLENGRIRKSFWQRRE